MRLDWSIYLQSKDNSKIIPRRLVKTAMVVTMRECNKQSLIDTANQRTRETGVHWSEVDHTSKFSVSCKNVEIEISNLQRTFSTY